MLRPADFKCNRKCGKCCIKTTVVLSKRDIQRITKLGYEEDYFVEYELIGPEKGKPIIKKKSNNWCIFLKKNNKGIYSCSIYKGCPEVCKKYPFFRRDVNSCLPLNNLI